MSDWVVFCTVQAVLCTVQAVLFVALHSGHRARKADELDDRPTPVTPPAKRDARLVWLDLETTGFEAYALILEIGIIVTDDAFNEVARTSIVVNHSRRALERALDEFVRDMHTENGLLEEVHFSNTRITAATQQVIGFLQHWTQGEDLILCGSSVHTDRRWLEHSMPSVLHMFSHRHLDASGLKIAASCLGATDFGPKQDAHRALLDLRESIRLARVARDYGCGWRALWLHVQAMGRVLRRML